MKTNNQRLVLIICLISITSVFSGCYLPRGDEVEMSVYSAANSSGFEPNPISVSKSGFVLDGYVMSGGGEPDKKVYENLSIKLYAKNGNLIDSKSFGDWNASTERKNVSLSEKRLPMYVIIDSPDFWEEKMLLDYFTLDNRSYTRHMAGSKNELPVNVSE